MFVSVVIPTFNRKKTLQRTLEAIARQTAPGDSYEIVVVDDCSSDDTAAYVRGLAGSLPNLVFLRHDRNQGRVITRNDGIRAGRGEVVIFLDDDNAPEEGFVEAHRQAHEASGDRHVVVMGNARYARESIEGSNFGRYLQSRYLGCRTPGERSRLDYQDLPPRCLGTLNCSVRRSDLLAVGLFDDSYRHYGGEDEDLGFRLSRHGCRIVFCEGARTLHYDEVTIGRYKKKLLETGRGGLRVQVEKIPDYVEGTMVRFLLPVDRKKDSAPRIAAKIGVRFLANPLHAWLLERWALWSDRMEWAYWPPVYRVLTAAWGLYGSRTTGAPLVNYGENR